MNRGGIQRILPNNNNNNKNSNDISTQGPKHKRPFFEVSPESQPTPYESEAQKHLEVGNMQVIDLKTMIETSLGAILDERLKSLPTKSDLVEITTKMQSLQQCNVALQSKLQLMDERCLSLERQIEFLERKSNERNLVLHIPSQDDDKLVIEKAKSLCLDLLEVNNPGRIVRTRLIRSRDNKIANVIIEMQESEDVPRILKSAIKLRNTGISIHRDYTKAAREKRRRLIQIKTDINTKYKNMKVLIRGQTLQIDNKTFYLDQNNKLKCDEEDGMHMLEHFVNNSVNDNDSSKMSNPDDTRKRRENGENLQSVSGENTMPGPSGVGRSINYCI